MTKTIQIIAMRTWGELGNLLAAKILAGVLGQQLPEVNIQVIEAETLLPRFGPIGATISKIAKTPGEPASRYQQYMAMMDQVAEVFYQGFEVDTPIKGPLASEIQAFVEHFRQTKPDLVVGTKGVISRVCLAALRQAGLDIPVVNYVTNEGLLRLQIHRSHHLAYNLVAFDSGRRYALEEHGFDPERVTTVGRLIAQTELHQFLERRGAAASDERTASLDTTDLGDCATRVVVFCNRGGQAYLRLLEHLATFQSQIALIFIGYNDADLVAGAQRLRDDQHLTQWRIFDRLDQGNYIRYLTWLAEAQYPLLISKTGPNTMLEAAYFGIPQLLLNSGLPMEQWVNPFIHDVGMGEGFENMDALIAEVDAWLKQPEQIAERKARAIEFSRVTMDQAQTAARIGTVFRDILRTASPESVR